MRIVAVTSLTIGSCKQCGQPAGFGSEFYVVGLPGWDNFDWPVVVQFAVVQVVHVIGVADGRVPAGGAVLVFVWIAHLSSQATMRISWLVLFRRRSEGMGPPPVTQALLPPAG